MEAYHVGHILGYTDKALDSTVKVATVVETMPCSIA